MDDDTAPKKKDPLEEMRRERDTFKDKYDSLCESFSSLEAQIADHDSQVKGVEAQLAASKREAEEARSETRGLHVDLNRASAELTRVQGEVKTLTRQLEEKDAAAETEREKLRKAQEKIVGLDKEVKDFYQDIPGIRAEVAAAERERDAALATIAQRDARIADLEGAEAELDTQRTVTTVLTEQIKQQRTEMSRFDLDPQAFRTTDKDENGVMKPQGRPQGNLEDELQEKTTSEEDFSESEEETPVRPPTTPPVPVPPPPPGPSRIIRIIERIPTYYAYHKSDHSLPYCSFITFVNAWVLINLWCREAWSRVGPTARKLFRIGVPGSQSPPPPPGGPPGGNGGNGSGNPAPPPAGNGGPAGNGLGNAPPPPPPGNSGGSGSGGNGASGSGNQPPPPNNNGNGGSSPAANEARPSERHSSEASNSGSMNSDIAADFQAGAQNQQAGNLASRSPTVLNSDEVMSFEGAPSSTRPGNWTQEGSPQSNQMPHMNVNSAEGGSRHSDDGTAGPGTPRSGSSFSGLLDPVPAPPEDGRERLEPGSAPQRSNTGGSGHSQSPPPAGNDALAAPGSTVTCLTAEQVEARFPLPDGASGPVDNYIINGPPVPPPAPPSPPDFWQLVTNPYPSQRPDVGCTLRDLLLNILFIYACYMMWVIYLERQNWKEANNIARAFFDDLYQYRCHYGRGVLVKYVPEEVARGFDWFLLYVGRMFGRDFKTYPMPG
jgi:hypothetical protein